MTDDEIIAKLKEADALLAKYREIVGPVADELAKKKSIFVFGKEGGYSGDLGCFEAGPNVICLHITPEFRGATYGEYQKAAGDRPYDFEFDWSHKVDAAGIRGIYISGHF